MVNKHRLSQMNGASRNGRSRSISTIRRPSGVSLTKFKALTRSYPAPQTLPSNPFAELTDADYELGLRSKLMGQVSLARIAKDHLRERGSITLTTGVLAMHPMSGSASITMVNAGLEGFVRAAALEMPRGLRINAVSPPWVKETMIKFGMDPTPGQAAADVAKAYVAAVEGKHQGQILDPRLVRA
jgi:NAD(P)-dependent dehydrogenase (short-subunit alcohol dehydrogenase family)